MGMPFENEVVGGTKLIIPAIQSPNYVAGSTGWTINIDGTVEFNSGTFRGTVTAGTFQGTDFIINQSGAFFYSGTPAFGDLIASIAPTAGTDAYGNTYQAGICIYTGGYAAGTTGGQLVQLYQGGVQLTTVGQFTAAQVWQASSGANVSLYSGLHTSGDLDAYINMVAASQTGNNIPVAQIESQAGPECDLFVSGNIFVASGFVIKINGETWHTLSPYASGVVLPTSGFGQYRLTPENEIQISASLGFSSPASVQKVNSNALPAAYIPATSIPFSSITTTSRGGHWFPVGCEKLAVPASPNNAGPEGTITSDGFIVIRGHSTTATTLGIETRVPLDV